MFPMTIPSIEQAYQEIKHFVGQREKAGDAAAGEWADSTADHCSPEINLDIRNFFHYNIMLSFHA